MAPDSHEEAQALDRLALLILQTSLAATFGGVAIAAAVDMEAFYRWLFVAGASSSSCRRCSRSWP
jgi:hypothetical protein